MEKKNNKMLIWGIGTAGEGFISSISGTYLPIFLTDVALVPVALSGSIMLVTSIVGFIMATITGGIIASIKPLPWGRLRSWLLIAPPISVIFFMIHFTAVPNNVVLTTILVILGYVVGMTMWNFAYASDVSLTNILGKTQEERNKFNSQRMMGSNIGRLMGNYLTPILVAALATRYTEAASYPILVLIAGVFFICAELIQFFLCKGKEDEYHEINNTQDETLKLKDIIETLKTNSQLLVTLCIDLTSNMAGIALPSLAVYYYRYVFEMPQFVPTHMLCIGLSGLCGSTLVRIFGRKVKSYKNFLMTVYLLISACLFCTRFTRGNAYGFLILNVCVHIMTGTTQPFEMNLYQDNVIYSEYKTGVNANSLIMGLCEFPVKIAGILKSVLITVVLLTSGFVAGADPTPALKASIANAYSIIPACIPIMGFLLLMFAYKLTPEKMEEYKRAIEIRATDDHM